MPLYDLQCLNGHQATVYYPDYRDRRTQTKICPCGHSMSQVIQRPGRFTYFSESSPRVIENLGHEPVIVKSHWEHQKLMRERGVGWITPKRGMPGSWT